MLSNNCSGKIYLFSLLRAISAKGTIMNAEGGSLGEGVQEVRGCIGTGPFETLRNLCALRGLNNFYREGRRVYAKPRKGSNGCCGKPILCSADHVFLLLQKHGKINFHPAVLSALLP